MPKMSMEEEIASLREEVERLKKEDESSVQVAEQEEVGLDTLVEGVQNLEGDVELKAEELLARIKDDYENMSPLTAVAIFAAGALFGRIFLSK